jgi:peroxiredoxin Q/BCP
MANRRQQKERLRRERLEREARLAHARRARTLRLRVLGGLAAALLVLGAIFVLANRGSQATSSESRAGGKAGEFAFAVGNPGPGKRAPNFRLPSTAGGSYELAARRGKTVLLYFQEGLMCQPCWDQITDLEKHPGKLRALGVDELVSITNDDLGQLRQKVADEGINAPILADPDLKISRVYEANKYGMMGDSKAGHSFLLIGPDGRIRYRADYGGEPDYTMYVPVDNLVADLRQGLRGARAS